MPPDRVGHDLAEHRLTRPWSDMPSTGEYGQSEQHGAEDQAQ
jgi:hypothetical protein